MWDVMDWMLLVSRKKESQDEYTNSSIKRWLYVFVYQLFYSNRHAI